MPNLKGLQRNIIALRVTSLLYINKKKEVLVRFSIYEQHRSQWKAVWWSLLGPVHANWTACPMRRLGLGGSEFHEKTAGDGRFNLTKVKYLKAAR